MVYVSIFIFIIFIESIIYKHENSARDLFENQEFQRSFDHISYMHDCINTVGLDHVIAKMRSIFSWLSNGLIKCVGFNKHNLVYTIKGSIIYRCISNWSFLVYLHLWAQFENWVYSVLYLMKFTNYITTLHVH